MILSPWSWLSKSKEAYLRRYQSVWQQELTERIRKLSEEAESSQSLLKIRQNELNTEQEKVDDLLERIRERRVELGKENENLREQIRLIEAKSKPDSVWVSAFQAGYLKAWDTMLPLMQEGIIKSQQAIRDNAVDETLDRLESVIENRIEEAGQHHLKPINELLVLKKEIQVRIANPKEQEKPRLQHHLEIIDWVLNGNSVR